MRLNKLPFLKLFQRRSADLVCSNSLSATFIGSRYSESVIAGLCLRKGIYCGILQVLIVSTDSAGIGTHHFDRERLHRNLWRSFHLSGVLLRSQIRMYK